MPKEFELSRLDTLVIFKNIGMNEIARKELAAWERGEKERLCLVFDDTVRIQVTGQTVVIEGDDR